MHIILTINSHEVRNIRLATASSLHKFQSLVYNLLPPDRASFLHNEGYIVDKRPMKLFAMSWPIAEQARSTEGTIEFSLPLRLVISSPVASTLDGIASGAMMRDDMHIGANAVFCEKVEVKNYVVETDTINVRTLSPITCYSQMLRRDGRKYTVYFTPSEIDFVESIHNNLVRKYRALYPDKPLPHGTVNIRPLGTPCERIAKFKAGSSFPIKGWSGRFELSGPKELLQVALDCGLGAKNSGGFGCIIPEG